MNRLRFILFVSLFCNSCFTTHWSTPAKIEIATESVTIEEVKGMFKISSDKLNEWPQGAVGHFPSQDKNAFCPYTPTTENFPKTEIGQKAYSVIIRYPGYDFDIYGILSFCLVAEDGGPATRSYQISIPEKFIVETDGGKVSVVYELYQTKANGHTEAPAWVLWMSRIPF